MTAPDRTTPAQGLASTAASATASTPTPWRAATRPRTAASGPAPVRGQAPVGDRLLDDHPPAGRAGLGQGGAGGRLQQVQVACTQANGAIPSTLSARARRMVAAWPGRWRTADHHPLVAEPGQGRQHRPVLEHTGVQGGRVDLVQVEVAAEQVAVSPSWRVRAARVVLDLVDVGVHAPVADVGVAHLEPTVTSSGSSPWPRQAGQERLGPAVERAASR